MSMRVVHMGKPQEQVDLDALSPRIRSIVQLVLRDAAMIDACNSGHIAYHFSRQGARETVRPCLTMYPPKSG